MRTPDFFSQTEYNTGAKEHKIVKLILFMSYLFKVISLIFIILLAIFSEWLYLIGFALLYAIGIVLRQSVLQRIESYEYFFAKDTIIVSSKNNINKQKTLCKFKLSDIRSIETTKTIIKDSNSVFALSEGKSIIKMCFNDNGITKNLYFTPNDYFLALIQKRRDL